MQVVFPPDQRAVYQPRTEAVRTGHGQYVRIHELHEALSTLDPYRIRKLVRMLGAQTAIADPFEEGVAQAVADVVSLCRGLPQYCLPLIQCAQEIPAVRPRFEELLRDSLFGTARQFDYERPADPTFSRQVARFFFETRSVEGELSLFITADRRAILLRPGQRFEDDRPYALCFFVVRTHQRRFYLHWPTEHADIPAFWVDPEQGAVPFHPRAEPEEDVLFEEIFPGYTYEVYGVQFVLPDLGTDYRRLDVPLTDPDLVDPVQQGVATRVVQLLELIEADPSQITTARELSKHFRKVSLRWHPLKHLQADDDEKKRIEAHYLRITNAYNELKQHFD